MLATGYSYLLTHHVTSQFTLLILVEQIYKYTKSELNIILAPELQTKKFLL